MGQNAIKKAKALEIPIHFKFQNDQDNEEI